MASTADRDIIVTYIQNQLNKLESHQSELIRTQYNQHTESKEYVLIPSDPAKRSGIPRIINVSRRALDSDNGPESRTTLETSPEGSQYELPILTKPLKKGHCVHCGIGATTQWRGFQGIDGKLCNSCGGFFIKLRKVYKYEKAIKIIGWLKEHNDMTRAMKQIQEMLNEGAIKI